MTRVGAGAGLPVGRVLLLALIPGLLLVDMVNGVVGGSAALNGIPSPGEMVRGAILLWALVTLMRVVHPGLRPLQLWVILLALLASLGSLLTFFRGGSLADLVADTSLTSKVLYGPALVVLLVGLIRRYRIEPLIVLDAVAWVAGVAGGSIALLALAGLGQATYVGREGFSKGLFISQNDIGVAMGIGLIAALDLLLRTRRPRYAALSLLGIAGMLLLGTRAAMAGAFALPLIMLVLHRGSLLPGRRRALAGMFLVLGFVAALAAAGALEYRAIQAQRFQQAKLQQLADNPFVRGLRVVAAFRYVRSRPPAAALVGEGMRRYERGVARSLGVPVDGVLAEVDWIDMFGAYGIVFAVLIYAYYAGFLLRARRLREGPGPPLHRTLMLAIVWFLLHSVVAGHALGGTIPAGTLAPILGLIWMGTPASPVRPR